MNLIIKILVIFIISTVTVAREKGETEITTEDGIEVYQNEKYYLLKKNVKIESDNFILKAEDDVKINFKDSLYNITKLEAKGNVKFNSSTLNIQGFGKILNYEVEIEKLKVKGVGSKFITEDLTMYSDGFIEVNNINGNFSLKGTNSKLKNENILIIAQSIDGIFSSNNNDNLNEITLLNIEDEKISYVKNSNTEMYAKKINFDNISSLIELIDDVTIIRDGEKISGDYGTLDTLNNSYKIKSNDQTKVKVIIQNNE
tara:strand:- start:2497 stop:3267 length:771 start_codon:yes stop_codon:yes gene_type:complete